MYTVKQNKKGEVELQIKISSQQWEQGVEETYQKNKNKYSVAGFRNGHAPRKAIEKEYGQGVFFDDTLNYFCGKELAAAVKENQSLEPISTPEMHLQKVSATDGVEVTITYLCVPDFEVGKCTGLTLTVHNVWEIMDAKVEENINKFLDEHSSFEDVDRAAQEGDCVLADFMGFVDGNELEGGSDKNSLIEIGSHHFIPGFEEQLVGHKAGETAVVNVTFPENYYEELAGKDATFNVEIKAVRKKIKPTMDDKFISNTTEFETFEEYKNSVTESVRKELDAILQREINSLCRHKLLDTTHIEIPAEIVDPFVREMEDALANASESTGLSEEAYLQALGYQGTVDEYMKQVRKDREAQIKMPYIYRKLARENGFALTDEDREKLTKGMTDEKEISRVLNDELCQRVYKFFRENNTLKYIPYYDETDGCACDDEECECHHEHNHEHSHADEKTSKDKNATEKKDGKNNSNQAGKKKSSNKSDKKDN